MKQVFFSGTYTDLDDTTTEYNQVAIGSSWYGAEADQARMISTDGVIKQLLIKLTGAPGGGKKYTFTVMLNGAPTALMIEIADTATSGNNMVHEVDVTGGDVVSFRCDPDATPTVRKARWSAIFEGVNDYESILSGGNIGGPSFDFTSFAQLSGASGNFDANNEDKNREICPTSGTIKNLYVKLKNDPGTSPDGYKFTLRKNGGSQTLTTTITADDKTGNDLVNSFTVAAGDVLGFMAEPLNDPTGTGACTWGVIFVADIDGESIIMSGSDADLDPTDTEYSYINYWEGWGWDPDESTRQQLGQVCTLKKFYILLSDSPGTGNSYTFTIRIAGANSNVVTVISDAATTGNSGALINTVSLNDYVNLMVVPDSTPTICDAFYGMVCYIDPGVTVVAIQYILIFGD